MRANESKSQSFSANQLLNVMKINCNWDKKKKQIATKFQIKCTCAVACNNYIRVIATADLMIFEFVSMILEYNI